MSVRLYNNNASDTLNGAITNSATTITLNDASEFPTPGAGEIAYATIDDGTNIEIITYTGISTNDLTGVTRGVEGTSGTAFADATTIEQRATEASFTDVLQADETPELQGPLDCSNSGVYIGFGGSSSSTAYCLNHTANVPRLIGAANYYWGFSGTTKLYCQAGTTFNRMEFTNDSTRLKIYTNNSERFSLNDSGLQLGAANARVTTILDEDTMSSDSATALATQQSIKAYVDSAGGLSAVVDDTTPQLGGELELNGNYIDFGGSSTSTAYCIVSNAGVPRIYGASNFYYQAGTTLLMNAGSTFHQLTFENSSNRLTIKTNNSNRFRVNDSGVAIFNGDLDLNTNNIIDTGNIQADQISFDSGSNYLNDYEEGTWTPVLEGTSVAGSHTYTTQSGTYTKIGQVVICNLYISISSVDGTMAGNIRIGGLPFTSKNTAGHRTGFVPAYVKDITFTDQFAGRITQNTTKVLLLEFNSAGSPGSTLAADIGSAPELQGTIIYEV